MNTLRYKGFIGSVNFSEEDSVFFGKIEGINGMVNFEGQSVQELTEAFHGAVDDYLAYCEEEGVQPHKSYSGSLNVRLTPEIHSHIAMLAQRAGISINAFIKQALEKQIAAAAGMKSDKRQTPITPPGSISQEHFQAHCTSCHLCVSKCPSHVLKPAFMEYGLGGMMQPTVFFEKGFCNFDCTVCGDVCPNGAILPLTKEQKHLTQMGKVVFIEENCIVYRDGTSCGACSEHCPTQALSMIPFKDGLTIPHIDTEICVGCGGCEYVCPARPFRAVYIEGNAVQQEAKPFTDNHQEEIQVDDFGF